MTTVASTFANSGQLSSKLARSKAARTNRQITGASIEGSARQKDDFYRTDPVAVEALLRKEEFESTIWEPACGDGAICEVLKAAGKTVIATDLVDRGYGQSPVDFLMEPHRPCDHMITNPPFKFGEQFIKHALGYLGVKKLALLMRLQFLEGKRDGLLEKWPPARIYPFSWRIRCHRQDGQEVGPGGGMIAFAWFVWQAPHDRVTTMVRMQKHTGAA